MISFLPELSHFETVHGVPFFVTTEGKIGTLLQLDPMDVENPNLCADLTRRISTLISKAKPSTLFRFISQTAFGNPEVPGSLWSIRSAAISEIGCHEMECFIAVETSIHAFSPLRAFSGGWIKKYRKINEESMFLLYEELNIAELKAIGAWEVEEEFIRAFFFNHCFETIRQSYGIENPFGHIGVIRLWKPGLNSLDIGTFAKTRELLPVQHDIAVSVRKLSPEHSQLFLQKRKSQQAISTDTVDFALLQETESALEKTFLKGQSLAKVEWIFYLQRSSLQKLKEELRECQRALDRLGECYVECVGAQPSWIATHLGSSQHQAFYEVDENLPFYLPLFSRGEGIPKTTPHPRALALHRRDHSLHYFDPFRSGFDGANILISGRRGKGKSVLANLLSFSWLNDPQIMMVKVDVGGSYVKECETAGGQQLSFNLNEPSGLNPFKVIQGISNREQSQLILSGFLETLLLEREERLLPNSIRVGVERVLGAYLDSSPREPSLFDFLKKTTDLPRRDLLSRWVAGGIFCNVFQERESHDLENTKYIYFNFQNLQNASDEDFSKGVMAAVIAWVNLRMLQCGTNSNRMMFFCDETPFFIQKNARFFKLTTANFRKFGHGTCLIAQQTQDFRIPKDGGGLDDGILLNSPIRFLFQLDGDESFHRECLNLTPLQIEEIKNLKRTNSYREVFLQDELGSRVLRVWVTPKEYWEVTSTKEDNEKLFRLRSQVPNLSLEEAIKCLATGKVTL